MITAGNVSKLCVADDVYGVTQLHGVVYMVCRRCSTILRFNATTHQQMQTDIDVKGLEWPQDIAACEQMSQLYVADFARVFRVSVDDADTRIQQWLPKSPSDAFVPRSLSVTSTRLLVTSRDNSPLIQFDSDGDELRRVQLPRDMTPHHAVESPTGTFIVNNHYAPLKQGQVVEVNTGGEVLRQFNGSRLRSLGHAPHVAVDSHGNVFVADLDNRRILLLDAHLSLRRVIVGEHRLNYTGPRRLCYREQSGQLLVALYNSAVVAVFDVLCR